MLSKQVTNIFLPVYLKLCVGLIIDGDFAEKDSGSTVHRGMVGPQFESLFFTGFHRHAIKLSGDSELPIGVKSCIDCSACTLPFIQRQLTLGQATLQPITA